MRLWEDFKAWRRGEKRVSKAPRGRVYERKDGKEPLGRVAAKAEPAPQLKQIKIIRADGTEEVIHNG